MLVLGLDVGTQGTKGLLVDVDPKAGGAASHGSPGAGSPDAVIARALRSYPLLPPAQEGAAEQHPDTWVAAAREVIAELLAAPGVDAARLVALGVSGQQHGLVVLDEDDEVVRPAKLWCDTSTAAEAAGLSAGLGRRVPAGFTASKIMWLARCEPQSWGRTRRVLLPHDFLNLRLTGVASMEPGDASGTGFFDSSARAFDASAVRATDPGLAERLPPLLAPGAPAGRIDARGAALFGLPEGLLVGAGSGDNMMSAVGSGATTPGVAVLSLGTSGTLFAQSAAPVRDPEGLIADFCDATGAWLPLLCVMNLTGVLEHVLASWPGSSHESLTAAAREVPEGCDGLLWLPFLQGERVPDLPHATSTLLGERPGLLDAAHHYRAGLEGTSLNLAWGAERLRACGVPVDSVRLVGGAARNTLWQQILADTLGAPVQRLVETESAALGAALHALWTARRAQGEEVTAHEVASPFVQLHGAPIEPRAESVARYAELRARFVAETERLFGG